MIRSNSFCYAFPIHPIAIPYKTFVNCYIHVSGFYEVKVLRLCGFEYKWLKYFSPEKVTII